ncbi:MAG: exonuclease SbcCD subunit D [Acidithiobacillus sp.]
MRILHTADWQIGRRYPFFEEADGALLAESRFTMVERLRDLARAESVDLMVVAGDVFDAQTVDERSLRRVFRALADFSCPCCLLPGNHDAALAESVWTRAQRLNLVPETVALLLVPEPRHFHDLGVSILPAPLTQRHTLRDATEDFASMESPPGFFRIGVAHGAVTSVLADGADANNPINPNCVEQAHLDYLALGDWHGTREISPRAWYSGTPEPDRFTNNLRGQVLMVEIAAPGELPVVRPIAVAQYRWQEWRHEFRVAEDVERLQERLAPLGAQDVIRLHLSGTLDLAAQRRLDEVLAEVRARLRVLDLADPQVRLQASDADIAELRVDGYLTEVVQELRQRSAHPEEGAFASEALGILATLLQESEGTR